jgi:hypothetical protein
VLRIIIMNVLFAFISSLLFPFYTFHLFIPCHHISFILPLVPVTTEQCSRFQQPSRLPASHSIFLHSYLQVKLEICSTYFNEKERRHCFRTHKDQSAASITSHVSLPCHALPCLTYPTLLHFTSLTSLFNQ